MSAAPATIAPPPLASPADAYQLIVASGAKIAKYGAAKTLLLGMYAGFFIRWAKLGWRSTGGGEPLLLLPAARGLRQPPAQGRSDRRAHHPSRPPPPPHRTP